MAEPFKAKHQLKQVSSFSFQPVEGIRVRRYGDQDVTLSKLKL